MIVQISMIKNELPLLKELLPLWKSTYSDGFVFMLDDCTDGTSEYLHSVKDQFNILEILERTQSGNELWFETDIRGLLFETARKYSDKIICLDADEYLDGPMTKTELEELLSNNPDTVFHLKWVQYTSVNTVRIDEPWGNNFKDRIGSYKSECKFNPTQMHSTHLPIPQKQLTVDPEKLFIAHLQWMNKTFVAIKQYFWKTVDYINNKTYGIAVAGNDAYDASVNNFNWEEAYTFNTLKVKPWLFDKTAVYNNYRLKFIKEQAKLYDIPNLGDWGFDLLNLDENTPHSDSHYKISVITAIGPIRNYGNFILRYLDNIIDQHFFQETEHIIVYSEWSDLFNEFLKYPNFKLVKEDERRGVYNAWNIGIKAATTPYVTNWNIDDLRHPLNTKIKYDAITKNQVDVVYNWYVATKDENENFYNLDWTNKQALQYPDEYEKYVMEGCYAGPDPLWKKSLHSQVGYFDYENYNTIGDWEMWIRFAKNGAKFKLVPEVLCLYLDHSNTVSQRQQGEVNQEKQRLYEKYK